MGVTGTTGVLFNTTAANSFTVNILRDDYEPGIVDTLNNTNVLYNRLKPVTPHMEGKLAVIALKTGRSGGQGTIGPGGKLPEPDRQRFGRFTVPMRHHYARIQVESIADEASASTVAAFGNSLDQEINGIMLDMTRAQNRFLHMDGTGRLAEINVASNGATVGAVALTLNPPTQLESPTTMTGMPATYFIHEGMRLGVFAPATATSADTNIKMATTVTAVTGDSTISCTAATIGAVATNDWVCMISEAAPAAGDFNNSSFKRDPMGLMGLLSDANPAAYNDVDVNIGFNRASGGFQGVDAAVYQNRFARANVMDGGGVARPPYEYLLKAAKTRAQKVNNANITLMVSSMELRDRYGRELLTDRRFVNTKVLSGGWTAIDFEGADWIGDRDAISNRVSFIDEGVLQKLMLREYGWQHKGDTPWLDLTDYDSSQARLVGRWNLAATDRSKLTLLTDISE